VVYDPDCGDIVHVHTLVVFEGADRSCERDLEAHAVHLAKNAARENRKMATLNIGTAQLDAERRYWVDPEQRVLVERTRDTKLAHMAGRVSGNDAGGGGSPGQL
jgi:hypothetical protein